MKVKNVWFIVFGLVCIFMLPDSSCVTQTTNTEETLQADASTNDKTIDTVIQVDNSTQNDEPISSDTKSTETKPRDVTQTDNPSSDADSKDKQTHKEDVLTDKPTPTDNPNHSDTTPKELNTTWDGPGLGQACKSDCHCPKGLNCDNGKCGLSKRAHLCPSCLNVNCQTNGHYEYCRNTSGDAENCCCVKGSCSSGMICCILTGMKPPPNTCVSACLPPESNGQCPPPPP